MLGQSFCVSPSHSVDHSTDLRTQRLLCSLILKGYCYLQGLASCCLWFCLPASNIFLASILYSGLSKALMLQEAGHECFSPPVIKSLEKRTKLSVSRFPLAGSGCWNRPLHSLISLGSCPGCPAAAAGLTCCQATEIIFALCQMLNRGEPNSSTLAEH